MVPPILYPIEREAIRADNRKKPHTRLCPVQRGGKSGYAPVEKHIQETSAELQIPPLRFASVGMTKGMAALS
jgi:hypothetical protein